MCSLNGGKGNPQQVVYNDLQSPWVNTSGKGVRGREILGALLIDVKLPKGVQSTIIQFGPDGR